MDNNIISDDIWTIVSDYATRKLIKCKGCKIDFCVIFEDQLYIHIDYELHRNQQNVFFQTSVPPFAEVIYCKPCYAEYVGYT